MIWLEHHGNRLYGVMGLLTKKLDGLDWMDTPETVMTNRAPALLKTNIPWKNLGLNMLNHFISPPFLYQMNLFELNLFGSLT